MRINKEFRLVLLALAAVFVALLPVWATPRASDDVVNYSFRWLGPADFARATVNEISYWAFTSGRVYLFSTVLKNTVFQFFETVAAYKAYLLLLNVACAAVLFAYVRSLLAAAWPALLALLLLPVFLQIRDYHDPVVAFNGLFQISAMLLFASLYFHLRYLRTGAKSWLKWCVAAFVLNLFFYELALITVVLVAVQDRFLSGDTAPRYRATRWIAITLGIYGALMLASRLAGSHMPGDSAYGLSFAPAAVLATFGKQLAAVLPFSYALFKPRDGAWGIQAFPELTPWLGSLHFAVALPAFFLIAWYVLRAGGAPAAAGSGDDGASGAPRAAGELKAAASVAALLVVLPAAIISVVSRYQGAFGVGNGYSFVYLQSLGAAMLLAVLVWGFAGKWVRHRWVLPALCGVLAVLAAGNLVNNRAAAAKLTEAWSGQYAWFAALTSSEMKETCAGVPLHVMDPRPWTEHRVLRHAGHSNLAERDLQRVVREGAKGELCVARSVPVLGRNAVAFARASIQPAAGALAPTTALFLVLPLGTAETRTAVYLGDRCYETPKRLAHLGEWEFAGSRYGVFAWEKSEGSLAWSERGFALPCEAIGK